MASDAAFARTRDSFLTGKCTQDVRFKLPDEEHALLFIKAREAGFDTVAEFLRMNALILCYGLEKVQQLTNHRLQMAAGLGSSRGGNAE
jgi:hypothetical protein